MSADLIRLDIAFVDLRLVQLLHMRMSVDMKRQVTSGREKAHGQTRLNEAYDQKELN